VLLFASSPLESLASRKFPELNNYHPHLLALTVFGQKTGEELLSLELVVQSRSGISPNLIDQLELVNLNVLCTRHIAKTNFSQHW
jgi:hypothetical protein